MHGGPRTEQPRPRVGRAGPGGPGLVSRHLTLSALELFCYFPAPGTPPPDFKRFLSTRRKAWLEQFYILHFKTIKPVRTF